MTIGDRIRQRRQDLGLTLEDVAVKVGVSRQTIQRYESGVIASIPSDKIELLADILSSTPSDLMGWTEPEAVSAFNYKYIPRFVAAGKFESVECVEDFETISIPDVMLGKYARNRDIVMMHVNGESMNRVIDNGALIAVLTNLDRGAYRNGDIVIAINEGETTIKRFFDYPDKRLIILNPDSTEKEFQPIVVPYDIADNFTLYGKVVLYSVML